MCEPTTWFYVGALIVSAASATLQVQSSNKLAHKQEDYQAQVAESGAKSAATQMAQIREREAQQRETAAREGEKARLATQKSVSTATVAAGEAGVSGNSVDALLQEYGMQFGQYKEASLRQQQFDAAQADAQITALKEGATNNALSVQAPVNYANVGAAALGFAGDAIGSTRDYRRDSGYTKGRTPSPGK